MKNYLVFDVGGTYIKYALIQEDGEMLLRDKVASPKESFAVFKETILSIYIKIKNENIVFGVSFSMPGAFNKKTGIIEGWSNLPYLHGPNVRGELEEILGTKIFIENDANCGALGELFYGLGKDVDNFVYLVLGTGIGGSVVIDRKLIKGRTNQCGEFGYMIVDSNWRSGEVYGIGEIASTVALVKNVAFKKGIDQDLLSGEQVFDMAKNGDEDCIESLNSFYDLHALFILNIQFNLDPDKIIISGAVTQQETYLTEVLKRVDELKAKNISFKVDSIVEKSMMAASSNLYGALYGILDMKGDEDFEQ